jgi:hypothetical protein
MDKIDKTKDGDVLIYRSIIERIHAGQNYYKAVGDELRARGYGVRPFFNWRLPLLAYFIAKMPSPIVARLVLMSLALLALLMWFKILENKGGVHMARFGSLLLLGTIAASLTNAMFLFHEMWAGVLIALSIGIHKRNRWLSVIFGLTALFIRELSLPFAAIMLAMAYKDKNLKESVAWLIGIFAFFIYLAIHAKIVSGLVTDSDPISKTWLQFGGWTFVLKTSKWTTLTVLTPWWIDSVLIPLSLIGLWGWRADFRTRAFLTMGVYICAFLIAGRSDNYYWGLMYAPLMPLGLIHAPSCLLDLCKAGFSKKTPSRDL